VGNAWLDALLQQSTVYASNLCTGTRTREWRHFYCLSAKPQALSKSQAARCRNAGVRQPGTAFTTKGYDSSSLYGGRGYRTRMNASLMGNVIALLIRQCANSKCLLPMPGDEVMKDLRKPLAPEK